MLSDKYNNELQELKFPQESYPGHPERLTPWFQAQEKLVPQEAISHSLTSQITFRRGLDKAMCQWRLRSLTDQDYLAVPTSSPPFQPKLQDSTPKMDLGIPGPIYLLLFPIWPHWENLLPLPFMVIFFLMCSTADGRLSLACDWQSPGFDLKNSRNAGLFCKCCKYSVILNWVGREVWFSSFLLF